MNKKEKTLILISYCLYYVGLIMASIFCYVNKYPTLIMIPIASVSCLVLPFVFKLIKIKLTFNIYIINLIFIFIANVCGSMLNGYAIAYFDKILHFTSGLLISELAFMIFMLFIKHKLNKNEQSLCILFINAFNMMIAVYWEFIEFACLIFFHNDAIHHYESGVYDCMQDMLVALLGGLIITYFVILYFKKKKSSIFIKEMKKINKLNF